MITSSWSVLALAAVALASSNHQAPFVAHQLPNSHDPALPGIPGSLWNGSRTPRIAVIGAGAGGSSAAFFLSHFRDLKNKGLDSDVTIFEASNYVGGRSTVVWPWNDDPLATPSNTEDEDYMQPVELGASIFVAANRNLFKAAEIFNLTLVDHSGEEGGMSIWDGEELVYSERKGWGWGYFDYAKLFWRYGRSPLWARSLVKKTTDSFIQLYSPAFVSAGAFASLSDFASATNLSGPASVTASAYFTSNSISPLFTSELVAAATTVNYGTEVAKIHGVGALVSLAATGAKAVQGGNRKLFQSFVGASGAHLKLGKGNKVTDVVKLDAAEGERSQWVILTENGGGGTFDAVIVAAPFHQTGISLLNTPASSLIPPQPYVKLHVSFVLTNASSPLSSYFSHPPSTVTSKAIFSTFDTASATKPTFNSLNYLKALPASIGAKYGEGDWHVLKMFSRTKLQESELRKLFGEGNVGKVWEKVWLAYPQLDPVEAEEDLAPVRPDEGLYYVNGFERLVSTLETETVSAFNVVSLLLQDFYGYVPPRSWAEWDA